MTIWVILLVLTLIAVYEILREPAMALIKNIKEKVKNFLMKLSDLLKEIASK
jgi:hypothetical protein